MTNKSQRDQMVARIEFPLLEIKLKEGLGKKKVPFLFATVGKFNVLTVRIVDEYFLDIYVDLDNVDRVIALTPYLIMLPDKAPDEFPCGTLRKVDYRLARSWKDVAVGGSV
jgi:hypothetical protein